MQAGERDLAAAGGLPSKQPSEQPPSARDGLVARAVAPADGLAFALPRTDASTSAAGPQSAAGASTSGASRIGGATRALVAPRATTTAAAAVAGGPLGATAHARRTAPGPTYDAAARPHASPPAQPATKPKRPPPPAKQRSLDFPVLTVPHCLPEQKYQTPTQVQSILSLPPTLLLQFARTELLEDQQALAQRTNATPYLAAMTLPPPSPSHLVQGFAELNPVAPPAPITSIGDHPAIPLLLGQAFAPPTPGITVPFSSAAGEFQPIFASVEDWSIKIAKEKVQASTARPTATSATTASGATRPPLTSAHSFSGQEVEQIAAQLKTWALKEEAIGIDRQVATSKETAVLLASQLSARSRIVAAASRAVKTSETITATSNAPSPANAASPELIARARALLEGGEAGDQVEAAMQQIDLTPYAEPFKLQLAALASGYFAQLHREALNRLASAAESSASSSPNPAFTGVFPTSQAPSAAFHSILVGTTAGHAMNVRAAASAAIAANVMAANEMALEASQTLTSMGVDVPSLVPERKSGGLASLEMTPELLAKDPDALAAKPSSVHPLAQELVRRPSRSTPPLAPAAPTPSAATTGLENEVNQLLGDGPVGCTAEKRDYFLAYAHTLYSTDPANEYLLPVLHTLETAHPQHLPTLLLMSCVYYSRGNLDSSLYYNDKLLQYDPQYVEAMSNIGTTLRAMGKWKEAETWWWKAIKLRPTYWDATENLLGVLCNPATNPARNPPDSTVEPPPTAPRFAEALALCDYVDVQVFRPDPTTDSEASQFASYCNPSGDIPRPRALPVSIPSSHVHRLQNLFFAKGNLKLATHDTLGAMDEFSKAVEVALSLPAWAKERAQVEQISYPTAGASLRDLVLVTTIIGSLLAIYSRFGGVANAETHAEAVRLGALDEQGQLRFDRLFAKVRASGDAAVGEILAGSAVLPTVLLQPEDLNRLLPMLFPDTRGVLPCLLEAQLATEDQKAAHRQAVQLASQTTSTMLLTIAKIFQDFMASPSSAIGVTLAGIPVSQSVLLPLYYVALALHPSPSTCNNLGILLSTVNATALIVPQPGLPPVLVNGQELALKYYRAGLALDPKHPHLYTNLGSLLKDMGQLPQAVQMYRQAVEFNPTFDVALANLANAIKDTGHVQESIPFYRRAVEVNPAFPEAICGLVNALGGVCDWIGRGGVNEPWVVDNAGNITPSPEPATPGEVVRQGYLGQISELVGKQLADGGQYGAGMIRTAHELPTWLAVISQAIYNLLPDAIGGAASTWEFRLRAFQQQERPAPYTNEGGFVIRLVERLMRRVQRRWYLTVYGGVAAAQVAMPPIAVTNDDVVLYRRPALPVNLSVPPVPTVLPFHVFTYPVSARETRLISHRTGLRISHNTLTQPWLPPHVYPPPPPPVGGKLNIGYVSSDLGNHPLSHLMQSVFGFHDLAHFNVFCYATSPSDKSPYRLKIEAEAQHFVDVSACSTQQIVDRIVQDQIHILVNLSGYTKGARNEVFACRPAPVQMSYMGFAGTLAAGWCDYFVVDPIVCPPVLVSGNQWRLGQGHTGQPASAEGDGPTDFEGDPDPEGPSEKFVYTEKLIYLPHSYFVTDHRQAWFEDDFLPPSGVVPILNDKTPERVWAIEEDRRWEMRKAMFPEMRPDTVIFANWNQLYKIDPFVFRIWLSILSRHPNSVLWLLRFPAPGERHLKDMAVRWAGPEVASRVIFTDVTNKNEHIRRGRIPDLFLDTTECNAHTTACDALAQGTPVLTWPRYMHKMCSRVAASVVVATGFGKQMIVKSEAEYEQRALRLAQSLSYDMRPARAGALPSDPDSRPQRRGRGELSDLRKNLFLTRGESPLFDTRRWVRNMESGYQEAWRRWVNGTEFEDAGEWDGCDDQIKRSGCIWVADKIDGVNLTSRQDYFN